MGVSKTKISAIRNETFKNLQIDAGAVLVNFDYSKITEYEQLGPAIKEALSSYETTIGATVGGCTFSAVPTMRQIEVDGKRYEFVGSEIIDKWDIKLTGTMKEIVPENFARVLSTGVITENEGKNIRTVKTRTAIKESDYIKSVSWVGETSLGAMMITLYNVLNTSGATMTINEKGEGTLPFEFVAHQSSVEDTEYAPYEIVDLRPIMSA